MDDVHSKEISLQYVTVKVPGQKPRGSKSIITTIGNHVNNGQCAINEGIGGLSLASKYCTMISLLKNKTKKIKINYCSFR